MSGLTTLAGLPLIMDAGDLGKVFGVTRSRAYQMIADGEFDDVVIVVGGRKRISRLMLERRLAGGEAA